MQIQGKSLSLICGALKWLRDQQNASLQSQIEAQIQSQAPLTVNDSEPEWVKEHHFKKRRDLATSLVQQEIERKRKWHNKRDQLRRLERFESKKMGGFTKKIKVRSASFIRDMCLSGSRQFERRTSIQMQGQPIKKRIPKTRSSSMGISVMGTFQTEHRSRVSWMSKII